MSVITPFIESLELTPNSNKLLHDLWDLAQLWDDVVDEEKPADEAIRLGSVIIPNNPIYVQYNIASEIAKAHSKWQTANFYEESKESLDKAYMLRASYYDIVLHVYFCEYGADNLPNAAIHIYNSYGETLPQLKEEVMTCQTQ